MRHRIATAVTFVTCLVASPGWTWQPGAPEQQGRIAQRAFFKPELAITVSNVPLGEARRNLSAAEVERWSAFFRKYGREFNVYLDSRSGTPTNIQGYVPLIPGDGVDNRVTLASLGRELGRAVRSVDAGVVEDVVRRFVLENLDVLRIDPAQLGPARVTQVTDHLWQVHFPQQVQGIPVRHGRLAATISHGNLVLIGTETWGNAKVRTVPSLSAEQAVARGLGYLDLGRIQARFWRQATLEIVPFAGQSGEGYGHRLVWAYGLEEEGAAARWEVSVDAHTGEVIAVEDENEYLDARITGGVYPLTNSGVCPSPQSCGTMQAGYPMPWANTGLLAPHDFTNSAGIYWYSGSTATTTLNGKYIQISDGCGAISNSSDASGNINLGGVNGQHDCQSGGGSLGNTAAARTAFYQLNKIAEVGRGWLPNNTWLNSRLTAKVNVSGTCGAWWGGGAVNFYRSGNGCGNLGEIAGALDHEWGHGVDNFDANGILSNPSEAYADIAAVYQLQVSCVGPGYLAARDVGCGKASDGSGYNQNEALVGAAHCNLNCSGVRDVDWDKHADRTPDTPQNFVCPKCTSSTGPCGRQVHCASAPIRQAAWDLVARDLRAAPFSYDSNTAFIIGNKLFYQGSGNIGVWYSCDCVAGTSGGCGATNGYMQWLAADDDNGNLSDGTPHMTAIHAAFNRHRIACATPTPTNGGCVGGPTAAPTASIAPGSTQVGLGWTSVTGASKYWVMRTEGHAGCDMGKAIISTVTTTSYTDTQVAPGRSYCYNIVAVGSSNACYSRASNCVCATPTGFDGFDG